MILKVWGMPQLPISLVVITLNEEANIERCLKSVPFAQDIVVLDSGSTDRTVEIAKQCGARTFVEAFRGYGEQKRRACELAGEDWVLSLDADEALSPALAEEIRKLSPHTLAEYEGYEMPRLSFHMDRWIRHGGWYPDYQLRLFNRKQAGWQNLKLHERVEAKRVGALRADIYHYVFKNLADQVETNNEYSTLGAQELQHRGRKFSVTMLVLKPISKFLETYIWKRGFLDGIPGFVIAVGAAYSVFLKFAKLWEQEP